MVFTGLEGIVVGVFEKCIIVHTRGFGRVLVDVPDVKMKLGDWCTLEAEHNTKFALMKTFKWARTCPYICFKMPTPIPAILPTQLTVNKRGAEYATVSSPVLIGAVKKKMVIGWSPQLGRVNIATTGFPSLPSDISSGDCFEGILCSVLAEEDVNGFCQWALRTFRKTLSHVDWPGVREIRAVYQRFQDGLCILQADDGSLISFGIADFVEEDVTPELIDRYHVFTVWVGPALASGDAVRAFLVKPSDEIRATSSRRAEEEAPSHSQVSVEQTAANCESASIEAINGSFNEMTVDDGECRAKALIKRLLTDKETFDTLYATDMQLLHELIETLNE